MYTSLHRRYVYHRYEIVYKVLSYGLLEPVSAGPWEREELLTATMYRLGNIQDSGLPVSEQSVCIWWFNTKQDEFSDQLETRRVKTTIEVSAVG